MCASLDEPKMEFFVRYGEKENSPREGEKRRRA
jgi:hypothetical protein